MTAFRTTWIVPIKKLLQYLRRNIKQVPDLVKALDESISLDIKTTLTIVKKIYVQQKEMYTQKKKSIEHRIVSARTNRMFARSFVVKTNKTERVLIQMALLSRSILLAGQKL